MGVIMRLKKKFGGDNIQTTDIATYRLNRPWGRFSENSLFGNSRLIFYISQMHFHSLFATLLIEVTRVTISLSSAKPYLPNAFKPSNGR